MLWQWRSFWRKLVTFSGPRQERKESLCISWCTSIFHALGLRTILFDCCEEGNTALDWSISSSFAQHCCFFWFVLVFTGGQWNLAGKNVARQNVRSVICWIMVTCDTIRTRSGNPLCGCWGHKAAWEPDYRSRTSQGVRISTENLVPGTFGAHSSPISHRDRTWLRLSPPLKIETNGKYWKSSGLTLKCPGYISIMDIIYFWRDQAIANLCYQFSMNFPSIMDLFILGNYDFHGPACLWLQRKKRINVT